MFHDFIFVIRLVIRARRIMACVEPHHIVFIHVHVTDICFFILVIYQIIASIALITHIYTPFIPVKIAYQRSFFKGDRGRFSCLAIPLTHVYLLLDLQRILSD